MDFKCVDFVLVIPCYNNIEGLKKSIKSINYFNDKFEVFIIDDGSTTPISMADIYDVNPFISARIIRLKNNQGIVYALNIALKILKKKDNYKYIARLDAGDLCYPQRFYKQVEYLNVNKEVALLGSWVSFIPTLTGKKYSYVTKTTHENIIKEMHYKCSFIHPSVMFRKSVLDTIGLYPFNFIHAEDYAYFWMILKNFKGAILPQTLVEVYFSNENISSRNYKLQLLNRKKVIKTFGDNFFRKQVGLSLLNLKLIMPKKWIDQLKYYFKK